VGCLPRRRDSDRTGRQQHIVLRNSILYSTWPPLTKIGISCLKNRSSGIKIAGVLFVTCLLGQSHCPCGEGSTQRASQAKLLQCGIPLVRASFHVNGNCLEEKARGIQQQENYVALAASAQTFCQDTPHVR
jgi:hypothetical protein